MKAITTAKNECIRFVYSKVLENTILTIIITALLASYIPRALECVSLGSVKYFGAGIIVVALLYWFSSREKTLKKAQLESRSFEKDWIFSETRIVPIAFVSRDGLYIQFSDLPVLLNYDTPGTYALEFKAQIQNLCFSWFLNAEIKNGFPSGYMFQYDESKRIVRPHILLGMHNDGRSKWATPVTISGLREIPGTLKQKRGWYSVRSEVKIDESPLTIFKKDQLNETIELYKQINPNFEFDATRAGKLIEINIFDMNWLGEHKAKYIFTEPLLKYFDGKKMGFRNYGYESSIYKDIIIKKL